MKPKFLLLFLAALTVISTEVHAQQSPLWIRNLDVHPDSAVLMPVRTLTDPFSDVYVLSAYSKLAQPSVDGYKIFLNKFDRDGNQLWTLIFDNQGMGQPRGFDMAIDDSGNCYIAGGLMSSVPYQPLLMKVDSGGTVLWQRDSTQAFSTGYYNQLILKGNFIYLRHESGIAMYDLNGNEQWSEPVVAAKIATDHQGRMIVSAYMGAMQRIFRYNTNGTVDISFLAIDAERIAVGLDNSIYLLAQYPVYALEKYDNSGVFQWSTTSFPASVTPFGDIGFEVLTDYYDDVIVIGLSDTMYKFRNDGTLLWTKSMEGLDTYTIFAQVTYSNFLAIAGTFNGFSGYDVMVALYDINGNRTRAGIHNATFLQEFSAGLAIDYYGIYLLEDSAGNSSLLKFENPMTGMQTDYNLVCVDSVWYEPGNPQLINVRVFNGDLVSMNYPSVQIVSPAGDTIGNKINFVNFFAHLSNQYQVYQDTITVAGINDFSTYTFLINEGFGDTTAAIGFCQPTGIAERDFIKFNIYPNPVNDLLIVSIASPGLHYKMEIHSIDGKFIMQESIESNGKRAIDLSSLSSGIYVIRVSDERNAGFMKFVKMD